MSSILLHETNNDQKWMMYALELAKKAETLGEVPVGAVLVWNNEIIGRGWNQPIRACDPSAHAEIIALREAASRLNNYRLPGTTLYVTLEPCYMCAGALMHARIERLVFGAFDDKKCQGNRLNHQVVCEGGLLAAESRTLLQNFFIQKR